MISTPRNKIVDDTSVIFDNTKMYRVYVTKVLGVQIAFHLSWKRHINYIHKNYQIAQLYCLKPIRWLENLVLQPFIIHLNSHYSSIATITGVVFTTKIWIDVWLSRKKIICIITGAPYQTHTTSHGLIRPVSLMKPTQMIRSDKIT